MDTFTALFLANRPYLLRVAFNVLHDQEEAKDIIQDAFCKLWEKREQLRFTEELKCLMARTVYRLSLDSLSRRKNRDRFVKMAVKGSADVIPERQQGDFVPRALQFVKGDRSRQIMAKLFQEGKTQEETAKEMGVTLQYVRNVSHESVKVLRGRLKGAYDR